MSRLARDGTAEPVSRDQFSGANGDGEIIIFPVQLTMNRVGNLTWSIVTLAICDDHTYINASGDVLYLQNYFCRWGHST